MVRDIHLTVTIPSTSVRQEKFKKIVLYALLVQCTLASGSQTAWQILVRYNEVAELFQLLKNRSEDLERFNFPPKRVLNGDQTIEDRRKQFERFLRLAVQLVPLPVELFLFLELDAHTPLNRVKYNVDATRSQSNDSGLPLIRPSIHEFVTDERSNYILSANNSNNTGNRRNSDPERINTAAMNPSAAGNGSGVAAVLSQNAMTHDPTAVPSHGKHEKHPAAHHAAHPVHAAHHSHPAHPAHPTHHGTNNPRHSTTAVTPLSPAIVNTMKVLFIWTVALAAYRVARFILTLRKDSPSKYYVL